jgi:hypothetical protein
MDRPMQGQGQASRLPPRSPPPTTAETPPERIPIDLGEDEWASDPPQTIDILAPPTQSEAANAAELKDCENQREAGVVAGEIVVCRELPADTSQLYSGSREAWLKDYAERRDPAPARCRRAGHLPRACDRQRTMLHPALPQRPGPDHRRRSDPAPARRIGRGARGAGVEAGGG